MRSVLCFLASGLLTSFLFVTVAFGQGAQTGGLTGVVTDTQGAVVSGATVNVINESTGKSERSVTTEADGGYSVTLLPPGSYRLEITAKNFKQSDVTGVQVAINQTIRQDVTLSVGSVSERVEITATPSMINPVSPVMGQAINAQTLQALPLASPNFLFLLNLSSGVTSEPTDVRTAGRGTADVNVNGQRTSNNRLQIEGVNVNDFNLAHFDTVPLPNPDTIQEFKVATSLYDASTGSKGGGAIGLVLRSGSKNFHYDLYWSHRNDALNATEWFFNANGKKKGRLLQNVFGGSGSGPIPKVGGYWFFNYQGVRARNGIDPNGSSTPPIAQNFPTNADGTTSAALLAPVFGLTAAQIDPVAVNILNLKDSRYGGTFLVPRSGQAGCKSAATATGTFTCQFSSIAPIRDNQYLISYDRDMRHGKDKISGRWFWDEGSVAKPFGTDTSLTNPRLDTQWNRFLSITETHIFSSTKVNELRAGYSRFLFANIPTDTHTLAEIGSVRGNSDQFPGMYRVSVTGSFSIGTGVNDDRGTISNQYNLVDTFSMVMGKHSLRFGAEGVQYQLNRFNNFSVRGSLTFGATTGTGNAFSAFQNFLRGAPTALQSAFGDPARNFIATDYAAFAQDDYRFSSRLTFNLGLRLESMSFGHDKLYRAGIYDPSLAARGLNPFLFPAKANLSGFTGTPGVSDCALASCRDNNWAPRVGFAWDIKGNQKTVLRGGYGLYFQRLSNQNILQNSLAAPFTVQPLDNRSIPATFQLANPLAGIPPPSAVATAFIPTATRFAGLFNATTSTVNGIPSNGISTNPADVNNPAFKPIFIDAAGRRCLGYADINTNIGATDCSINLASFTSADLNTYTPYTQQYNLTLQHDFKGWVVEVGYVGSHFVGGIGIWDPYLATLVSPSSPITLRDANGVAYTLTTNTVNNEELRHQILGLSRKKGARYSSNIGFSIYNSLQTTVSRRLQKGLYFQAAYTFSKTIDNVSGSLSTDELNATRNGQNGANIYNNQANVQQNKARGDFDRPHRLVVSYTYDLPFGRGRHYLSHLSPAMNKILGDWSISGITTYQSGLPFSVTDSTSGGLYGTSLGTATLSGTCIGANSMYTTGSTTDIITHYLNPACFTTAPNLPNSAGASITGWGDTPRNAFRAPFQQNWDFSLIKGFTIREKHVFQLRADFFNLFNHPIFSTPNAVNIGTLSSFTQITQTAVPARLIQFALKYSF